MTRVALLLALAACGDDYPQCERLVEMTLRCDETVRSTPAPERNTTRELIGAVCKDAYRDDTRNVDRASRNLVHDMYSDVRERAECVRAAETCAQYERCTNPYLVSK